MRSVILGLAFVAALTGGRVFSAFAGSEPSPRVLSMTERTKLAQAISGEYPSGEHAGGDLSLLDNGYDFLLTYRRQGASGEDVCRCTFGPQQPAEEREGEALAFRLNSNLSVVVTSTELQLRGNLGECCGGGWVHDLFERSRKKPTRLCTIKSPTAFFYSFTPAVLGNKGRAIPLRHFELKAGEQVVTATNFNSDWPDYLPALRTNDPKWPVAAFLKKADVTCPGK